MSRSNDGANHRSWLAIFDSPNRHADSPVGTYELVQQPQRSRRKSAASSRLNRLLPHKSDYQELQNGPIDMSYRPVSGREIYSIQDAPQDYVPFVESRATRDPKRPLLDQNTSYHGFVNSPPLTKDLPYIDVRDETTDKQGDKEYWNPFWLRSYSLISLSILFLVFVLAIVLIWHFGRTRRGYPVESVNLRFLWTYGPTFVLVIVVALWREVEYFCKVLTPWQSLRKGQAPVDTSLTLDYVSPLPWKTVSRAIQHRHLAVVVSSLGFWILKLTVVASSGFLVLGPTLVTLPQIPVQQTTKFVVENYNGTNISRGSIENQAVYAYYGITQGVSLPAGTINNDIVFAQFVAEQEMPANSSLVADTDIFSTDFACEAAEIDSVVAERYQMSFTFRTPRCQPQPYAFALLPPPSPIARSRIGNVSTVAGRASLFDCNGGEADDITPDDANTELNWFILTYNGTLTIQLSATDTLQVPDRPYGGYLIGNFSSSYQFHSLAGVVCAPMYSVSRARVAYNNSDIGLRNRYEILSRSSSTLLPGLSPNDFTRGVYEAGSYFGPGPANFFDLMSASVGTQSLDRLHDVGVLGQAASIAYKGLAAQYALSRFSTITSDRADGTLEVPELRLYAGNVSTWVMLAGFIIAFILTVLVLWSRPWSVVAERPDSTFALATILRRSPRLQESLSGTGSIGTHAMMSRLSDSQYSSTMVYIGQGSPALRIDVDQPIEVSRSSLAKMKLKWHSPVVGRKATIIGILSLPLTFIAILEVLQQLSNRRNGFISLTTRSSSLVTREEAWRLSSAFIMLLVATAFTSLDFVVLKYTPFARLKRAQATASDLKVHLLGSIPPSVIWKAFRLGYWGALFSTSAALVGSLLTIVVSGLFIARNVEGIIPLQIAGLDSFTPMWIDSATNDSQAALTLAFIERSNLSYSRFTYGELALPSVGVLPAAEGALSAGSRITLQLPAWRAGLSCSAVPRQDMMVITPARGRSNEVELSVRAELPSQCQIGGPGGNSSTTEYNVTISLADTGSTYRGSMLTLHLGPYMADRQEPFGNDDLSESRIWFDNPAGCPTLVFTFGDIDINNLATLADRVTTLVCSQQIEEITTDVTFVYPEMSIDRDRLPIPDESTRRYINVTSVLDDNVVTALPYRIQANIDDQFVFVRTNESVGLSSTVQPGLDAFFTMLLSGKDVVDPATLVGTTGESALFQSVQHLYRKYMAQAISFNMRVPIDGSQPTFAASARDYATSRRLFVVEGPKAALQGMLAFMFVAGALAYFFTPLRDVIMHNPTSIAGTMSMLAGSRLCDPQWQNINDAARDDTGRTYRLGWWGEAVDDEADTKDDNVGGQRFGIDSVEGTVR